MPKTTQVLFTPPADTVVKPVHIYNDEQKAILKALRDVRTRGLLHASLLTERALVRRDTSPARKRPVRGVGAPVA
jgi:hypothetical protein